MVIVVAAEASSYGPVEESHQLDQFRGRAFIAL